MGISSSKKLKTQSLQSTSVTSKYTPVDIGDYELIFHPKLGFGSFGQVGKGKHKTTKAEVAVKIISFVSGDVKYDGLERLAIEEKDKVLSLEKHDNIVEMLGYYVDSTSVMLFMELCNLGDLGSYMSKKPDIFDDEKLDILNKISIAINFLHQNKPPIVHRDIKPGNVLMTDLNGKVYAKVCDFGFARLLDEGTSYVNTNSAKGTTVFMAPEMFGKKRQISYSTSADVFSLGLLFLVVWQYSLSNKRLIPFIESEGSKAQTIVAFGELLKDASAMATPLPVLVQIADTDSSLTRKLKQLILQMTVFGPQRIAMEQVQRELAVLLPHQLHPSTKKLVKGSLSHKLTKSIPVTNLITVINGHIWLCNAGGIDVYNPDLELLQQIRHKILRPCHSAALLPNGHVVAVGWTGAAVVSTKGTVRKTISTKGYTAVRVHGGKAYMMTGLEMEIHVYECEHWVKVRDIAIPCTCGKHGILHTLVITDRHIIVACSGISTINLLRHNGALHPKIGPNIKIMQESSSSTARDDTSTTSRLSQPRLCERVDGDALLVADQWNHRLLVLSAAGEWRRVHLQGKVWWPRDVTWANDMLYVIHADRTFAPNNMSIFA